MIELVQFTVFFLVVGAFAGLLAGLLGVGGGLIIVPGVVWVLEAQRTAPELVMHIAIGTSLASIVVTAIASVRAHHRRGAVRWPVFWQLTPGIVIGALVGAGIVDWLPGGVLRVVFAVFVFCIAAQMAFGSTPAPHRVLPGRAGMSAAGGVIGTLSAIVGIGGGSLTVPFLTWCNVTIRQAVATSSACGLPIALAGTAGFMFNGWGHAGLPAMSLGYVFTPALLGITIASTAFAPLGARFAHTLPSHLLRRVFAGFLALVGSHMLLT